MKITIKKLMLTLSFIMLTVIFASAQVQNLSVAISSFVNTAVTGTPTVGAFASQTDIENGLESSAIHLVVQANVNWKLTTEIGAITAAPNADSPAVINSPLTFANFKFATTSVDDLSSGAFTPFDINSQAVTNTGTLGDATVTGNTFNLKLKITPGYEVDPANYTIPIIMTFSGQ